MPTERELLAANIRLQLGEYDDPDKPVAVLVHRLTERNKALAEALADVVKFCDMYQNEPCILRAKAALAQGEDNANT